MAKKKIVKQEEVNGVNASTSTESPPKKKKKIAKRKIEESNFEEKKQVYRLNEKFGKKRKELDAAVLKSTSKATHISNPESYKNVMDRAEELQGNKLYQIEIQSGAVATAWRCALCHERTSQGDLGDLFGPHYINAHESSWPDFLAKKPGKGKSARIDVWLHGKCALWAPDIHMMANQLSNLEEKMKLFWSQSCFVCHQSGASINVDGGKFAHYPCALVSNVVMEEGTLSCKLGPR